MNLDDLMAVWRSQDAAPLHGVDKTLLHLALRQDEVTLQKQRRRDRWIIYAFSVGVTAGMAVFLTMMILSRDRNGMTAWDYALPITGAIAAVLSGSAMYVHHRRRSRREQRFGDSLREQLNRRIAQLNDAASEARLTSALVLVLMCGFCPMAILVLGYRVNQKPVSDDGYMLVILMVVCAWSVGYSVWELRRQLQHEVMPRKRRLEALLKELDA